MITILLCNVGFTSPLSTSSLPGNVNFDPLNLASRDFTLNGVKDSKLTLNKYREAELKHGRLAMLAAVAYPIQEAVNPILSKALYLPNVLPYGKLSPSLLNGNLRPSVLLYFLAIASGLELYKMNQVSHIPGDYNWRFTDARVGTDEFLKLQAGEIWNSRIAMIATLGYVVQEYVTKYPVLEIRYLSYA